MSLGISRRLLLAGLALSAGPLRGQPAVREVSVAVPGPRSTVSLPADVAANERLDAALRLQLRLLPVSGGAIALQQLVRRNCEFAIAGLPAAMLVRSQGERVVAVAALERLPHYQLIVRGDLAGEIRSVAALRGRTIGVHSASLTAKTTSHLLAELVLRGAGVGADQVRFVSVGQNWDTQASAFRARAADAIMGDEAFSTRLVDELGAAVLYDLGDPRQAAAVPGAGFLRGTLLTREELVQQEPALVEQTVRTFAAALSFIHRHPPRRVAEASGATGAESDHLARLLTALPDFYARDPRFSTAQLRETERFFRASMPTERAAQALAIESMVVDRWSGRRD